MDKQKGVIVAVCISDKPNVPKYPKDEVVIDKFGIKGDVHAGETRMSRRTGKPKPNDRQISIVAKEVLDSINSELGTILKPGDFGENILTEGLGDLGNLTPGQKVLLDNYVTIEITEQNDPCVNLQIYHKQMIKKSYKRRGVLGIIKEGIGHTIKHGMTIEILP